MAAAGPAGSGPPVVVESVGRVGVVRLDRPGKLNALDGPTISALRAAVARCAADDGIAAVLLEGAGRSFCAGGDQSGGAQPPRGAYGWYAYIAAEANALVRELLGMPKPVVAAVQGHAYGAGMCLALTADLVVAADDARFCMPYLKIANKPDFGASYLLPRRVASLSVAKDLIYTSRVVDAPEALRLGLANRLEPLAGMRSAALSLASDLAAGPAQALALSKAILDRSLDSDLDTVLAMEAMAHGIVKISRDHAEGVAAFFGKRPPTFTGE
ncbi:enoyl-CoA hydratase/isomerase family protein [Pseudonocardia petroleophila]|uniref:Enoyl-CoA hydratase/isomerase family protein n=1 Tax=Pseudonocardia petroleophila TaxID=37331 RepID=A0A7G7MC54_9PSEU|nr:enoyl-CoA hydratase-related protein [Pseudonocardia petroleophila]QNG50365.1 enoyl-CoA hydratase/isomerase family protein [Pseudonocardia petroleophila]